MEVEGMAKCREGRDPLRMLLLRTLGGVRQRGSAVACVSDLGSIGCHVKAWQRSDRGLVLSAS